jgi:hypothetical protein
LPVRRALRPGVRDARGRLFEPRTAALVAVALPESAAVRRFSHGLAGGDDGRGRHPTRDRGRRHGAEIGLLDADPVVQRPWLSGAGRQGGGARRAPPRGRQQRQRRGLDRGLRRPRWDRGRNIRAGSDVGEEGGAAHRLRGQRPPCGRGPGGRGGSGHRPRGDHRRLLCQPCVQPPVPSRNEDFRLRVVGTARGPRPGHGRPACGLSASRNWWRLGSSIGYRA